MICSGMFSFVVACDVMSLCSCMLCCYVVCSVMLLCVMCVPVLVCCSCCCGVMLCYVCGVLCYGLFCYVMF